MAIIPHNHIMNSHSNHRYDIIYDTLCDWIVEYDITIIKGLSLLGINSSSYFYRYIGKKKRSYLRSLRDLNTSKKYLDEKYIIKNSNNYIIHFARINLTNELGEYYIYVM